MDNQASVKDYIILRRSICPTLPTPDDYISLYLSSALTASARLHNSSQANAPTPPLRGTPPQRPLICIAYFFMFVKSHFDKVIHIRLLIIDLQSKKIFLACFCKTSKSEKHIILLGFSITFLIFELKNNFTKLANYEIFLLIFLIIPYTYKIIKKTKYFMLYNRNRNPYIQGRKEIQL